LLRRRAIATILPPNWVALHGAARHETARGPSAEPVWAARLGLEATHFTDPHGVGGADHHASAVDLAMLMRVALRVPEVGPLLASASVRAEGSRALILQNGTALLDTYPGLVGVKTGFTDEAGPTIVAAAERDGRRLIVALLNAPNRVDDAAALLDWGFANYVWP
jgi:D-alanyl-D-alanine carboxypeptidase (penicillin-binding protein 5/6)